MEQLDEAWLETTDPAEQTRLEREDQLQALRFLPFVRRGRYLRTSVFWERLTLRSRQDLSKRKYRVQ